MFINLSSHKQSNSRRISINEMFITQHRSQQTQKEILYYENGHLKRIAWIKNHKYHRPSGAPAVFEYFQNGIIKKMEWHSHGKACRPKELHQLYKPSSIKYRNISAPIAISYFDNGQIQKEEWTKDHHIDTPALITYFKNGQIEKEEWFINGIRCNIRSYLWYRIRGRNEK